VVSESAGSNWWRHTIPDTTHKKVLEKGSCDQLNAQSVQQPFLLIAPFSPAVVKETLSIIAVWTSCLYLAVWHSQTAYMAFTASWNSKQKT